MSQPNSSKELQKFTKIKELIRERRLEEARRALQTMPNHPVARDWLAKLDGGNHLSRYQSGRIRVTEEFPFPSPISSLPILNDPNASGTLPILNASAAAGGTLPILNRSALPFGEPSDPLQLIAPSRQFKNGYGFGIIGWIALNVIAGIVIMGLRIADNWKRLGKPEWAMRSSIANVLFGILGAAGIIGIIAILGFKIPLEGLSGGSLTHMQTSMLSLGVLSFFAGTNMALMGSQVFLQRSAYKEWYATGTVESLQQFKYNFDTGCILATVVLALFSFLGMAAAVTLTKPTMTDTQHFSLQTASYWEVLSADEYDDFEDCRVEQCQAVLSKGIRGYERNTYVFFFFRPRNGINHPDRLGEQLHTELINSNEHTFYGRSSMTIDGQPAAVVDYAYVDTNYFPFRYTKHVTIFVLTPQHVIEIHASHYSRRISGRNDWSAVYSMLGELDLKAY